MSPTRFRSFISTRYISDQLRIYLQPEIHSTTYTQPSMSPSFTVLRPIRQLTRSSPSLSLRSLSTTTARSFNPPRATKMPAPPKKMHHLQAINAIPSQYPEFRNVLWTGESSQLVVMTVPVGGDIGEEVHSVDQHLIFTSGVCKAIVAGEEKEVKAGDMVIVPQGTKHNCTSPFSNQSVS